MWPDAPSGLLGFVGCPARVPTSLNQSQHSCPTCRYAPNKFGWKIAGDGGDARKIENTGFTCDAMPESWNDLGFLMLCAFKTGPFLIFAHIVFLSIDHLLSLQRNLTNWPPPPDRGYPGSPFYLLVASSFPGERKPLNKI